MKAATVIATHGNTDFDAFASMLAARRLYPDAVVCLSGSLNRNVREFSRLHADELELVEASRLDLGAIRRLIVVETIHAPRLNELEPVALDPSVEKVLFDHHAGTELPDWIPETSAVVSGDGAHTTTLVGILAERGLPVTEVEATAFALGIHEDTGSLTYRSATQRDAEALAWCLRHGARQELLAQFLHSPLTEDERELLGALLDALEPHEIAGVEVLVGAVGWPRYVDGVSNLAHKVVDLTDTKALALLVEMDERVFCVTRSRTPELDASRLAGTLGGGGHPEAASAIFRGRLGPAKERLLAGLQGAVRELPTAAEIMSSPPRTVAPDDTVASALVTCQRYGQSG
ncbi:MAG TPA: DHHA1 domain-containing protein, partial [Gaiellaceae bacterium]|nr:DHHA1 domain-containing protein [Gaiellaceae bacterium]